MARVPSHLLSFRRIVRRIDVAERRARLARRHRLGPGQQADDVAEAAESMVCLHGTDPGSVYLSAWARVEGMTVPDLERALYVDRSLVKHLAMRRTLFVFPRESLGFVQAGASHRVADIERRRLIKDVEKAALHQDAGRWLADAGEQVLSVLSDGREATSSELRDQVPLLEGSIEYGQGKSWGGRAAVGPRVLTTLSAAGQIVRASNDGAWTTSRPRWASVRSWLGEEITPFTGEEGVTRLVEAWLRVFGPGKAQLFDTSGNAGPTAWWDGRIVGGWRQGGDTGEVMLQMLEDVGAEGLRALDREAERLTEWLGGTRVLPRFPSPLSKAVAGKGS